MTDRSFLDEWKDGYFNRLFAAHPYATMRNNNAWRPPVEK